MDLASDIGAGAGVIAAIFAALTFIMVLKQISIGNDQKQLAVDQKDLANKQLVLANQQNELAIQELALVKQQGEIMARQDKLLNRKARMLMYADVLTMHQTQNGMNGLRLAILNYGNKTADSCTVVLMIPQGAPYPNGSHFMNEPITSFEDKIGKVSFMRYEFDIKRLFFQDHTVVLPAWLQFTVANNVPDPRIRYQLIYADDSTPSHYGYSVLHEDKALAFRDEEEQFDLDMQVQMEEEDAAAAIARNTNL